MAEYDRPIASAKRMIAKKGQTVFWRQIADAVATDENAPWKVGQASGINNTVKIVFLPVRRQNLESFGYVAGTEVPKGAVYALMAAVPFEPNLKDVVIRDGVELRIANIEKLAPNGQAILYKILFKS